MLQSNNIIYGWLVLVPCSITEACLILQNPMDCSLPNFSVHVFQVGILEWIAISSLGDLLDPEVEKVLCLCAQSHFSCV